MLRVDVNVPDTDALAIEFHRTIPFVAGAPAMAARRNLGVWIA